MKTDRIPTTLLAILLLPLLLSAPQIGQAQGETTVQEEANKEVIRRLVTEVKNRSNPAAAAELVSPDYVHHFSFPGETLPPGPAGSGRVGEIFGIAFPEITVTLEILIADGEFVLERSSVEALHAGEFLGIPATNRTVTWTENHLYRIVDGQIVEHWPELDIAGLLEQMEVFPAR